MTAYNYLTIVLMGLVVIGWGTLACAQDDVTIVPAPSSTSGSSPTPKSTGTGIHKSAHKKKKSKSTSTATASSAGKNHSSTNQSSPALVSSPASVSPSTSPDGNLGGSQSPSGKSSTGSGTNSLAKSRSYYSTPPGTSSVKTPVVTVSSPGGKSGSSAGSSINPTVETGLPVARYPAADNLVSTPPVSIGPTLPPVSASSAYYHKSLLSPVSTGLVPTGAPTGNYSEAIRMTRPVDNFVFTNYSKTKVTYPWKTGIFTTKFWIGEGGSSISPTDNISSAWDLNWRDNNGGTDNPNYRNGYASGDHAFAVNPFYVALPFNDLVYPEKARQWLPANWYRKPKDGKAVSWCKDRWVQIKNAQGRSCYAQWEDVGPLRSDHAEYVFGDDRPDTYTRAGLDVSPAVAQYLGIDSSAITSWRFVDEEDVRPGEWLRYDELALLYQAMKLQKGMPVPSTTPIQRSAEPIDDQGDDSNKKRVGAAKG